MMRGMMMLAVWVSNITRRHSGLLFFFYANLSLLGNWTSRKRLVEHFYIWMLWQVVKATEITDEPLKLLKKLRARSAMWLMKSNLSLKSPSNFAPFQHLTYTCMSIFITYTCSGIRQLNSSVSPWNILSDYTSMEAVILLNYVWALRS